MRKAAVHDTGPTAVQKTQKGKNTQETFLLTWSRTQALGPQGQKSKMKQKKQEMSYKLKNEAIKSNV